jgi:hypothetical protein
LIGAPAPVNPLASSATIGVTAASSRRETNGGSRGQAQTLEDAFPS